MTGVILISISIALLIAATFVYIRARRIHAALRADTVASTTPPSATHREKGEVEADRRALTVNFLELHSAALERFDASLNSMRRKISAGQTAEVHRMLKSETLLDDYTKTFNESFDRTIFNLYPNFIEQVNKLLHPEKRIEQPDDNRLTTELRVLAFTCIGIEDTTMIARFLRLSHNTIYTYRNRMRARALDRERFDEAVQNIGISSEVVSA